MSIKGRIMEECVPCRLQDKCGTCMIEIKTPKHPILGAKILRICCDCVQHCADVKRIEGE